MGALRIVPILLLVAAAAPVHHYTLDAGRSAISARVAFFGLASKTARFPKARGELTLDPAAPDRIDLDVVLDATALVAPDRLTRDRLKGRAFFDVEHYPTIRFRGTSIRMTSALEGEVRGQITARGVTRPATLAVRFDAPPAQASETPLTLTGSTTIDRREFGMTAYPLIVGRKVTITLRTVMIPA